MGLFSVRGRLPQPAGPTSAGRLDPEESSPRVLRRLGALPVRFGRSAEACLRNTGREVATRLGKARLAAIAATNDARIVGILLILAAVALGLEMAASFHLI